MDSLLKQAAELYRAGRRAEARACLRDVAEGAREDPAPLKEIANLAASQGDWSACREYVERLVVMLPDDAPGLQTLLGNVCYQAGDLEAAGEAHRAALALDATRPEALAGLATIALAHGRPDAAEELLLRALDAAPGNVTAMIGLAAVHDARGEPLRAVQLLQPLADGGLLTAGLVRIHAGACRQLGEYEQGIGVVRRFLQPARPPGERADALFALAGLYEAAGRTEEAFTAAAEANRVSRAPFDPEVLREQVDRIIRALPRAHARSRAYAPSTAPLVFIAGMPRSGTRRVEQMLGQHPAVLATGAHGRLESMARRLEAETGWPWERAFRACSMASFEAMAEAYLAPLGPIDPGIGAIIDAAPLNVWYLGLAARVFPAARIVWCRRDPLDAGVSCFMESPDGPGEEFAGDLAHIGHYIRQVDRLMHHWRHALPLPLHEVRYEVLADDPRRELAHLLQFLGLPWDEAALRFRDSGRYVTEGPGRWLGRATPRTDGVGRHRAYEAFLGPLRSVLQENGEAG